MSRVAPRLAASALALSLVHCSDDGGASGAGENVDAFLGVWSCDATSTIEVTTPSGTPDQTQTTHFMFEVTKVSDSTITAGDPEAPACSDELTVSGSKASLKAPFECTQDGTLLKVTGENLAVSGNQLTGTRKASVSGTAATGEPIAGTGKTTIDCTRISDSPDGGATGVGNCRSDGTCVACCSSRYPAGSDVLTRLLLDCTCQQCGNECATSLCNATSSTTPAAGDTCETCARRALGETGQCAQSAASACQNDADCAALARCLEPCPGSPI